MVALMGLTTDFVDGRLHGSQELYVSASRALSFRHFDNNGKACARADTERSGAEWTG
jgi:hypothetical protein